MRSGREHCGSRVAVEQGRRGRRGGRGGGGEEDEAGGGGGGGGEEEEEEKEEKEEEEATDIKSNNPHLAGGETRKKYNPKIQNQNCRVWKIQLVGFVFFLYFGS